MRRGSQKLNCFFRKSGNYIVGMWDDERMLPRRKKKTSWEGVQRKWLIQSDSTLIQRISAGIAMSDFLERNLNSEKKYQNIVSERIFSREED